MIEWPNLKTQPNIDSLQISQLSPESNCCKFVENGWIKVLVVFCVFGDEAAKSFLPENNWEILLVGDLLKLSSNEFSGRLGEVLMYWRWTLCCILASR